VVYREHTFVERCFCNEPATRPCKCCGRARCEVHLERALCNRCTQFVGRELSRRASHAYIAGAACGFVTSIVLLAVGFVGSVLIGIPLAVGVGVGYKRVQRANTIRALGPAMSTSKGELPALPRNPDLPRDSSISSNIPPGFW
jgi:hypothetical protein